MSTRCQTPFHKKMELVPGVETSYMALPCGKCPACVRRRVSGWAFRLHKHSEHSKSAHFVTLTYSDENIKYTKNRWPTLVKKDLQDFFKRLRKLTKQKISYYAVGEYGDLTDRPHYHIILFNANPKLVEDAWSIRNVTIGNVHFGDVSGSSINYVLSYINKKWNGRGFGELDDRQREFAVMSKGLGAGYLSERVVEWHTKGNIENKVYLPLKDGKKAAMPRYYKDKLYDKGQKFRIGVFMRADTEKQAEKLMEEHGDLYDYRMAQIVQNDFKRMERRAKKRQKI